MTTENREDYLIAILRLTEDGSAAKTTELAQQMGVSPASVSEMLKILAKDDLVEYAKYRGVKLTNKGLTAARLTRKRHHIVERFFIDVLGLDHRDAHEEAHRIEHSISDDAAQRLCDLLGNPPDCDCQCCVNPCKTVSGAGISITSAVSDMGEGEKGKIAFMKNDDSGILKKLIALGLIPGKDVAVESQDSSNKVTILNLDGSTIVLGEELSGSVYVEISC